MRRKYCTKSCLPCKYTALSLSYVSSYLTDLRGEDVLGEAINISPISMSVWRNITLRYITRVERTQLVNASKAGRAQRVNALNAQSSRAL